MTLGMGSLAMASSSAFCRPSASVAPGTTLSRKSASALPSGARLSCGTTEASAPSAASFLSSAGVGEPSAASATATGISFCCTARSAARAATPPTCTARRRGEAKALTAASAAARPWACSEAASTDAKDSPSFFRALGGSSSTNSSTSRLAVVLMVMASRQCSGLLVLVGGGGGLRGLLGLLGELGAHLVGPGLGRHREAQAGAAVEVALGDGARQVADAADVGGAFGHADGAAGVEQVEGVRGLEHLLVAGQRELLAHQVLGLLLVRGEGGQQELDVAVLEVVGALLDLVLVEHVAVLQVGAAVLALGVDQVVDVLHALEVHGQTLQAVGDLAGDGLAVDAAHLLEVGELRHLHAVEPDLPPQAPGAQRGVLPVVLDEAHVVLLQVEAQGLQAAQVQLEDVGRRRLEHHLVLVVVLQAVGVLAVAAVLGAAAGLHISGLPGLGADGAQEGGGVRGARAHFHVVGLQERAALGVPIGLQLQDDLLEGQHEVRGTRARNR